MYHIIHEENQWLVIWTPQSPILIKGSDGQQTSTKYEHDRYPTRSEAVSAILRIYPEWVDPNPEEMEEGRPVN